MSLPWHRSQKTRCSTHRPSSSRSCTLSNSRHYSIQTHRPGTQRGGRGDHLNGESRKGAQETYERAEEESRRINSSRRKFGLVKLQDRRCHADSSITSSWSHPKTIATSSYQMVPCGRHENDQYTSGSRNKGRGIEHDPRCGLHLPSLSCLQATRRTQRHYFPAAYNIQ